MSFPPPPTDKLDWSQLSMAVKDEVNGHVEVMYKNSGWQKPRFVEDPYLRIHGLSPCINYGQEAHEGMKAYRDPSGQIRLFRVDKHAARIAKSANFISIPPPPADIFRSAIQLAVAKNAEFVPPAGSGAAMYVRPVILGFGPSLLPAPPSEFLLAVYVQPLAPLHGTHALDALVLEEYDRSAPLGTGGVKLGGNYAPIMRWQAAAGKEGYGLLLHVDSKEHKYIDEFSTAGFVGVKKTQGDEKPELVVSASENIIQSVTTDSVAEIAKDMGWKVERRQIDYDELSSFEEVIAAGTAAALVPVRSITRKSLGQKFDYGDKVSGSLCLLLREKLLSIQQGQGGDKFGWSEVVPDVREGGSDEALLARI